MLRYAALVLLALSACGGPRRIAVQVKIPDFSGAATPLPGVEVSALPFDRDSLLAVLERRAPTGRPHTRELDSLFQGFRTPFLAFSREAWDVEQLQRRRDSLSAARRGSTPGTPGARELDLSIARLDDSLRRLTPGLERARQELDHAREALWPRIEQLTTEVRRWEHSTYAPYDTIVRGMIRDHLRTGMSDTTDALGWATLTLPSGRWWIVVRALDVEDPTAEWYWNLPAEADTLRLTPANARRHPRY